MFVRKSVHRRALSALSASTREVDDLKAQIAIVAHSGLHRRPRTEQEKTFLGRLNQLGIVKFDARPFVVIPAGTWPVPGKQCEFMGNIIVDGPLEKLSGRFTINGAPFDGVLFPLPWPGASSHFWFGEVNDIGGFKLTCDRIPEGVSELEINYSEKEQPKRFRCVSSYFFPLMEEEFPLPDEVRRVRVIGSASIDGFRSSGYTDFRRLDLLCKELFGRALGEMGRVLDWGCGCGRVTRHLAAQARRLSTADNVHGADIDGDNASWCGQNLGINARQIPLVPPTEFPDGGFDLVFGISVFTHLSEENQFKWLAELRRIVRPGGIVLTTVHGVTAYQQVGIPIGMPELAENWAPDKPGFFVSGSNRQLDGFIESNDYYLNVFHSSNYIRSKWSQFFDVVEIIPGALGTHDLVVLRKPV